MTTTRAIASDAARTASHYERTRAFGGMWHRDSGHRVNLDIEAGGPIDAPEIMPAGACESISWLSSAGRTLPAQCLISRDE